MDPDLSKLLSILKGQDLKTPTVSLPVPLASVIEETSQLDLSNISQSVINQVRNEYLVKTAKSITPEVLVTISKMVQETELIQVLKKCKERQDNKERELFSHRESVQSRYQKQKDSLSAKELIGVQVDVKETQMLEMEMKNELRQLDLQIIKDMDKEVAYLQQEFVRLQVPLFKLTNQMEELKLQQRVLIMLQDMI